MSMVPQRMPYDEFQDYFKTGDEKDFRRPNRQAAKTGFTFRGRAYFVCDCGHEGIIDHCPNCQRSGLRKVAA